MWDPLAEVVTMLQPSAGRMKLVSATEPWRVVRAESGSSFTCVVLAGRTRLQVAGRPPMDLEAGDFLWIPAAHDFVASSPEAPPGAGATPFVVSPSGDIQHGDPSLPVLTRMIVGHGIFTAPDAALLVSLLPDVVPVRGAPRLATLLTLVADEAGVQRAGRALVLTRLLEVVLVEALRSTDAAAAPGLLRGLADERVAPALRAMHASPATPWTVGRLARQAGLSRSAFFARFERAVGMAPMHYLLGWRMALAKQALRDGRRSVAEVAAAVGYGSASAFSVAFTRVAGVPPSRFAAAQGL